MNLDAMYRIPWTMNDNPNGWVEVTTHCQLTCPGCYRDFDAGQEADPEEKLRELKADTDTLVSIRNIQTLSIAGGEPLLFPLLDEFIAYVRSKGVAPRLFTNAVLLTEKRLRELVDAGLAETIIHASLWQNRLKPNTLDELLKLKAKYCDMFRSVGNVRLGFIEPAMRSNLPEFGRLFAFYQKHADVVANVIFTIFKDEYGGPHDEQVPVDELSAKIVECYGTQPCAYIPKIFSQEKIAWLLNVAVIQNGKVVGAIDQHEYEAMQELYHAATGKYLFTPDPAGMTMTGRSAAPVTGDEALHHQVVSIVDSPQMLDDGRVDMCDSCPDAILYKGKLVPKCILDKIKGGLDVAVAR